MKTIEALAPGLYEMKVVEGAEGTGDDRTWLVSFAERRMSDLARIDDGREDEARLRRRRPRLRTAGRGL